MNPFIALFRELDETNSTNAKLAALVSYFRSASVEDLAHAIYFLAGNKLKPTVSTRALRVAAIKKARIPEWLFEETYEWVGDLAETVAAIVPGEESVENRSLADWVSNVLQPIANASFESQVDMLGDAWSGMDSAHRFVMNKLLTGNFRVGVSQKLLVRAISQWSRVPMETVAHRMMGRWEPIPDTVAMLLHSDARDSDISRPYPFCLAHSLPEDRVGLGSANEYTAEWKWDGIRAQLVRRKRQTYLWSRGEETLHGRFPELDDASNHLPDGTVLDGEILAWSENSPMAFAVLQRRIQRKRIGPKLLQEAPVVFVAYDLLEYQGEDIRNHPFRTRRMQLESLWDSLQSADDAKRSGAFRISRLLPGDEWEDWNSLRATAREHGAEGLMVKRADSPYGVGRVTGSWWKWKLDPYSVDAVVLYAQRGHGKRATLFTDYTFGVWDRGQLVPFAKAYSGLTQEEIRHVDRWIRDNTTDKFGPVHAVRPGLVMEIAFENVQRSTRHKCGFAVRFPRISRLRHDKTPDQADSLDCLRKWIDGPLDAPEAEDLE